MSSRPYDFWLFDLDGTIVDVEWSYIRAQFDRLGDRLNRTFSDREAEVLWYGFGGMREDTIDRLEVDRDRFWTAFDSAERPADRIAATTLYGDAVSSVPALPGSIGLVTHCREDLTDDVLDRLDIAHWFDTVVCCSDALGWKPEPAPVYRAIDSLGVSSDQYGVLVGDGATDVGAAWNAGLEAIHIDRFGPDRRGACVLGDGRIQSLTDLVEGSQRPTSDPLRSPASESSVWDPPVTSFIPGSGD